MAAAGLTEISFEAKASVGPAIKRGQSRSRGKPGAAALKASDKILVRKHRLLRFLDGAAPQNELRCCR
jgi:hypothetical protein